MEIDCFYWRDKGGCWIAIVSPSETARNMLSEHWLLLWTLISLKHFWRWRGC